MKLGIRADANAVIAMGHLMRCMAIAQQCRERGSEVLFFISDEDGLDALRKQGFSVVCLHNSYCDKDAEVEEMVSLCQKHRVTHLLVDSYEVTQHYLERLREYVVLAYLDDLNLFAYPVDVLINYAPGTTRLQYLEKGTYDKTRMLLGTRYIPLREEFLGKPIGIRPQVRELLITTGGSDPYHVGLTLVKALAQGEATAKMRKYVVLGRFSEDYEALQQIAGQFGSIQIYQNITNMAGVMRRCDLAVSAGGITLAELCACGVPTIAFTMADNQMEGTKAYANGGILCYAGDARKEGMVEAVLQQIQKLQGDEKQRSLMSTLGLKWVDGQGAGRIVEELMEIEK